MKFIALISGGKDSTFAIHECQRMGHELVALANLYPLLEDGGDDAADSTGGDLDSWCFQTVGHALVAAYARCCPEGVPLYRRATRGAARRRGLSYPPARATPGDEVEDLAALLAYAAERHRGSGQQPAGAPPLGVCTGAVASDYQRLRVEAVACARLGLVSLSPLWRRAQAPLLRAMDDAGVRAVIAKVAAAGLDPRRDLGADVACARTRGRLARLRRLYGLNVCGEGGEYETLTLDAPEGVFPRGRVEFGSVGEEEDHEEGDAAGAGGGKEGDAEAAAARRRGWRMVVTSEDAVAPGGVLVPVLFRVVPRCPGGGGGGGGSVVEVPRGYEAPAPPPAPAPAADEEDEEEHEEKEEEDRQGPALRARVSVRLSARHAVVGCRVMLRPPREAEKEEGQQQQQGAAASPADAGAAAATTARAVRLALRAVERAASRALPEQGQGAAGLGLAPVWPRALFVHLLLPAMAHFAAANAAYCAVVPGLRPPARACVEAPLPAGCVLHVDVLLLRGPSEGADGEKPGKDGANDDDDDDDDDGAGGERAQARMGRRVLHVQSVSPWAPACIGPYSQAVADGKGALLHLAGQIPLDPTGMELVGPAAAEEGGGGGGGGSNSADTSSSPASPATVLKHTNRVLRSCQAVAIASGGRMDGGACAGAAVYLSPRAGEGPLIGAATAAVASFLREGRTAWAAGDGGQGAMGREDEDEDEDDDEEEEDDDEYVDEYLRPLELPRARVRVTQASWAVGGGGGGNGRGGGDAGAPAADATTASSAVAACVYAVVPALPRGALVEVQPTLLDLRAFSPGGGAGEPPSSSSSEDGEEERAEAEAAAATAQGPPPPAATDASIVGARAHLRAYSWLARAPAAPSKPKQQQQRLAARLLVSLPSLGEEGGAAPSDEPAAAAAAAAVASALREARALLPEPPFSSGDAPALNVVSVRAWCTPEAYAGLAGGGGDDDDVGEGGGASSPLDIALAGSLGAPAAAQLLPALEVRCGDGEGSLSEPCAAVIELVILH